MPSILVFGPQTELPSKETLAQLRQELCERPELYSLHQAIKELPKFWQTLTAFDESLTNVPGSKYLGDLQRCAIAVSASKTEADIAAWAVVSLRLAVCIGAYVDQNGAYAEPKSCAAGLTVRWKDGHINGKKEVIDLVQASPSAYISSINDNACVTITVNAHSLTDLTEKFHAKGMRVKPTHVQGRFHSTIYSSAVGRLMDFFLHHPELQLPDVAKMRAPVRSTVTGDIINDGSFLQPQARISEYPAHSIAIVGMAGRFPGADSLDELWDLLRSGKSMVKRAPSDRLGLSGLECSKAGKEWWGNFLRNPDAFDHKFFKKSSREAVAWDPQQRILLEVVYEALESAGYFSPSSKSEPNDYGCYIGAIMNNYYDNVSCNPPTAYATNLNAAGFLSPSGQCKPFDASADGYCRGEGVSVVVLKPLATALEENHNILGVIVGSAVNQNPNHSHITVPNSGAQSSLYRKVMSFAGVEPEAVSYVEAHGTGTSVGDPVECQSIREAFGGPLRDKTLYFSSIKGNIGHTEATAGVSGLVKVLLMMQHGKIPPQASYNSLNPKIPALEPDRMEIPRSLLPWTSSSRLASDRANRTLPHVLSTAVTDLHDVERKLTAAVAGTTTIKVADPKPIILVFGGQESDFIGLSEEVYHSSALFSYHLDACNEVLLSHGNDGLYPAIFQRSRIADLVTLHTALFSVQYASAKSWIDCGLEVGAVIGHSFGQLTALCISGVLSLPDALKLVAGRATIMLRFWGDEPGSMLYLHTVRQKVVEMLDMLSAISSDEYAEVACYNGPKSHVVVGSTSAIGALEKIIANSPSFRNSVRTERLKVTHGFHSKFTEPLLPYITALARELTWMRPTIHLETCDDTYTVADPDFHAIAEHTRRPVFFQQAVERLRERYSQSTWLEAGQVTQGHLFLSPQLTMSNAQDSLTDVTIDLWKAGYSKSQYRFLSLPPYQFEKSRHWLQFKDRSAEKKSTDIVEGKPDDELLAFLRFRDVNRTEAIFRISSSSDRFKAILSGHIMAGQRLAPASLYFEVAARAALFLVSDKEAVTYVPTVENLHINSPIGQDTTKEILLYVKRIDDMRPFWSFSITVGTLPTAMGHAVETFVQSTGTVYLRKRGDSRQAQKFKRFESLTGFRRYQEIISHPEAETMQGNHIYRAFSPIVQYSKSFQGIKSVACVGMEAAGKVSIHLDSNDPADQRLTDTPMMDSFMQLAGMLVNYFNNSSLEDFRVCFQIEHIEIGGQFTPDAKNWIVYSNMTEEDDEEASSDAYVFEAESKKMVMAAFGFRFSRIPRSLLARLLRGEPVEGAARPPVDAGEQLTTEARTLSTKKPSSARRELLRILHDVTDIPLEKLTDESTLEDLGIDSLGATEVLNDIRAGLDLSIDLSTFLFFPNIQAIAAYIDETLGLSSEDSHADQLRTNFSQKDVLTPNGDGGDIDSVSTKSTTRVIISAYDAFRDMRFGYGQIAALTGDLDFWSLKARLVLAYVVEAYAELGWDVNRLEPGDAVPEIQALLMHRQLVRQFYCVLEDGNLIEATKDGFVRTSTPVDTTPADEIFEKIYALYPRHASVHKLIKVVGSEMAACLRGDKNGLQLVFGNKENKRTLEDIYENWPLLRTPTILLGDFLLKAFKNCSGSGEFRILEVGAGTGGTTRYIVDHLRHHGIPFEYNFTDISASPVAAARKSFAGIDCMSFEVLDIEKRPVKEREEYFHVIIATNCIHATRNLEVSLLNVRKMIHKDRVLSLIKMTRNMSFFF
ncbi:putative Phthiocerol synthesis polyketide synthase type I PpsA [Lindgomyces ingoldianus]|uniref:Phthiocerol synthesis polyketide synthase type I PpsA n=1 Tax=Lindgomyces ingoldianus TaxID=673940 RepID=A0ACB6QV35_9PLEO|nr:putative Phthiocerol synthesis polyketide synthase type I PpsA [Lindgomyces ingoldianus]KAF2470760.1 putative Phthiocerol synthesis polyketide synthase type I PpsA [Lindgomyces ingoldianus]